MSLLNPNIPSTDPSKYPPIYARSRPDGIVTLVSVDEITPFFEAATSFNFYAPAALILSPTVVPAESVVSACVPLLPIMNLV